MLRLTIFVVLSFAIAAPGQSAEPRTHGGLSQAQWIQSLSNNSPKVRAAAARALAEIGGAEAIGPLMEQLADRDADVRLNVAYALGRINKQPQQSIRALTQLLHDNDEHVRYSAQWSLGQIAGAFQQPGQAKVANAQRISELLAAAAGIMAHTGAPESLQRRVREAGETLRKGVAAPSQGQLSATLANLIEDLQAPDIYVQVRALAKVKHLDPAAAPLLIQALAASSKESILEWKLPEALAELGPAVVPALSEALESDDELVQDLAINVLRHMSSAAKDGLHQLNKILADEDAAEERVERVLATISNIGPPAKASTALLAKLVAAEQSDFIRIEAMRALSAIGTDAGGALPTLMKVLRSEAESNELRIEAMGAVCKIALRPKDTVKALLRLVEETDDSELKLGLAAKLGSLGPDAADAVPLFIHLSEQTNIDASHRQAIVLALGEIGAAAMPAIPTLVRCLADPDDDDSIHVAAAITLGKLGPGAVSALAVELQNPNVKTRVTIARAMVALGAQSAPAAENLGRTLADEEEDDEVRVLAAIALGKLGPAASAAIPVLTRLLQDQKNDDELRAMCAIALGGIDPAAASALKGYYDDPSKEVQVAAAYAICKMRPEDREAALRQLLRLLADDEAEELAARALADIGKDAVPLLSATVLDSKNDIDFRVRCIEAMASIGQEAAAALLTALNDSDLAESAQEGLERVGDELVPLLLIAADDEARYSPSTRQRIQELVRYFHDGLGAGGDDLSWGPAHPLAKLKDEPPSAEQPGRKIFRIERPLAVMGKQPDVLPAEGFKTVKVFYGTNRKPVVAGATPAFHFFSLQSAGLAALAICLACLLWQTPKNSLAIVASGLGLVVLAGPQILPLWRQTHQLEDVSTPAYGSEFSDRVEMGVCSVTIPDIHEEGDLEGPSLLRLEIKVDPEKHIVLRSVQPLAHEAFFVNLEGELAEKGRNVLVFIHGYNVSFEDAARRTAQMAADLKFPGAAAFYSWPSQAHWYKYRLDEKNVELSIEPLKAFLLEVAVRSNATTINLVAHSMGNRALTGALKEIDASARGNDILFNQVVLAAPDIDADIFKQQIAPAIVTKAHRITLYASSKDLALYASRQFNSGDSRAGDVGDDLVVVPGIETIDASAGDCSLLGHCYYGDSVSVLRDIERLLKDQPAQARPFLHPIPHNGMTYWLFEPTEVASEIRSTRNLR